MEDEHFVGRTGEGEQGGQWGAWEWKLNDVFRVVPIPPPHELGLKLHITRMFKNY